MPCYCDTPDESNQAEIQRRCKETMYFDACGLLSKEQLQEAKKQGLKQFPEDFNQELCKICKILTIQQMKMLPAYYFQIKWEHETLYDWHLQHCRDDLNNL